MIRSGRGGIDGERRPASVSTGRYQSSPTRSKGGPWAPTNRHRVVRSERAISIGGRFEGTAHVSRAPFEPGALPSNRARSLRTTVDVVTDTIDKRSEIMGESWYGVAGGG
jgi:hypothetical protein